MEELYYTQVESMLRERQQIEKDSQMNMTGDIETKDKEEVERYNESKISKTFEIGRVKFEEAKKRLKAALRKDREEK